MKRLEGADSGVAPRRTGYSHWIQGLKPLATIVWSLRDCCAIGEKGQTPAATAERPPYRAASTRTNPASMYWPPEVWRQWIARVFRPGRSAWTACAVNGTGS